ncbi:MAG TPA: EAL domain-containing protein, partial [Gammaproteobacteria bacterium]|nr:EAL domain-containing protein [Gammaproteobacteria bacterium]
ASLEGSPVELQDVLVQLREDADTAIPAAKFMPYAERHNLMQAIDKWVIAHALPVAISHSKSSRNARFFVRVSSRFLTDPDMLEWLRTLLKSAPTLPEGNLIFQIPEVYLDKHLRDVKVFIDLLRKAECSLAIAQFGQGRNSLGVLDHLKVEFIKLKDDLVAGMNNDEKKRQRVEALVEKAKSRNIETIAQRVESADTIALLWQMGVQYIQGNYLQEPGAIIEHNAPLSGKLKYGAR